MEILLCEVTSGRFVSMERLPRRLFQKRPNLPCTERPLKISIGITVSGKPLVRYGRIAREVNDFQDPAVVAVPEAIDADVDCDPVTSHRMA
jgi:hypothetical protein